MEKDKVREILDELRERNAAKYRELLKEWIEKPFNDESNKTVGHRINTYKKESKQRGELIAIRKLRTRLDGVKEKDRRPSILLLDDNEEIKIETAEDCKSIMEEIVHAQLYAEKDGETYISVKTASRVMFLLIMIAGKAKIETSLMWNDLNRLTKEKTSQRLTSLNLNFEQLEDRVAKQQEKITEQAEEMRDTKQLLGKIYAQLKGCEWLNKPKRNRG